MDIFDEYKLNVTRFVLPKYIYTFDFEAGRLKFYLNDLIVGHPNLAYIVGACYLSLIFFIQWLMTKRGAFSLRKFAVFWNTSLLVINFLAFVRLFPHLWFELRREQFFVSICVDK